MLKKKMALFIAMCLLLTNIFSITLMTEVSAETQAIYYVDPVNGVDTNPGTFSQPFRTIEKARDSVRIINSNMSGDIYVYLRGGTYILTGTLAFTQDDSGTNGYNVIYMNYGSEAPVISGGKQIAGWTLYDATKNIYRASAGLDIETRQFYVNGVRATRARSSGGLAGAVRTSTGYTTTDNNMQNWGNKSDIQFVYDVAWDRMYLGVNSISGTAITMQDPAWTTSCNKAGVVLNTWQPNPSFVENAYELIDAEGEWYLDRVTDTFYYKPRTGENMSYATVVVPVLEKLISGTGILSAPIHNIRFQGITFADATWLGSNGARGFVETQAMFCAKDGAIAGSDNWDVDNWVRTPANITFTTAKSITFEKNIFKRLGSVGLEFISGSQDNIIRGNEFTDISGTAVQIGGITTEDHHPSDTRNLMKNNDVANNYIHACAVEYKGGVGIWNGYTEDTNISHNYIENMPYSGISNGWGWGVFGVDGYPDVVQSVSICKDNKIMYNHITNIMNYLCDGGGIYSLGKQPGLLIQGNVVHNQQTLGGAIYLDDQSRYATVTNNVIYDITINLQLKGQNHVVIRNFWSREDNPTSYPMRTPNKGTPDFDWMLAYNDVITSENAMPASVLNNAGLEPAYRYLCPTETPADTTVPSAPSGLTSTAVTEAMVNLSWAASSDNTGVTGYEIYLGSSLIGASSTNSYMVHGLAANSNYSYTVKARDAAKNLSAASTAYSVTTGRTSCNLALNKPAYSFYTDMSIPNIFTGTDACNAVDGDPKTYSQVTGQYKWIQQVDLGGGYDINKVVVNFVTNPPCTQTLYATDFYVMVSNVFNSGFTTVATVSGCIGGKKEVYFPTVKAQYVRIEAVKPDGPGQTGGQMAISELEVYENDAYGKATASCGQNSAGEASSYAVNGLLTDHWCCTDTAPHWLLVDLGKTMTVARWIVKHAQAGGETSLYNTKDFKLQYSNDMITFYDADIVNGNTDAITDRILNSPVNARWIRLYITTGAQTGQPNYARINDFEVYATNLTPNIAADRYAAANAYNSTEEKPLKAVNGSTADQWCSTTASTNWLWIDLRQTYSINRWIVKHAHSGGDNAVYNTKDFKLQISSDGINFIDVDTVIGNSADITDRVVSTSGRYVRLYITQGTQSGYDGYARIRDIEIYGSP